MLKFKTKKIVTMLIVLMLVVVNLMVVNAETNVSNKSYDELWLQEILEYETDMGNMIDEINGTDGLYLNLALSDVESDREIFVNHVIDIFDELTNEQKRKITGYLIGYADGVDDENVRKFVTSERDTMVFKAIYSPSSAKEYAHTYYKNYNLDEYPNLNNIGGDCANFVSQCIYAGGKEMDNKWYIKKLNNKNPEPTTVKELDESWDLADPSPWISAKEFGIYWSDNALKTATYSVSDYLKLSDRSISGYATGDVVQLTKRAIINYYGYHTMLITKIDGDDFLYSAHYADRKDENLTNSLKNYNSSSYKVKFYAMY